MILITLCTGTDALDPGTVSWMLQRQFLERRVLFILSQNANTGDKLKRRDSKAKCSTEVFKFQYLRIPLETPPNIQVSLMSTINVKGECQE